MCGKHVRERFANFDKTMTATLDLHGDSATDSLTKRVDSGIPGYFLDDQLTPMFKDWKIDHTELEQPRKLVKAGEHMLLRTAAGTITRIIADSGCRIIK